MCGHQAMEDQKVIAAAAMGTHQTFSPCRSEVPQNPEVFLGMERNVHPRWLSRIHLSQFWFTGNHRFA